MEEAAARSLLRKSSKNQHAVELLVVQPVQREVAVSLMGRRELHLALEGRGCQALCPCSGAEPLLRAETPACTALAGISPALLQPKDVPAHFPSFLDVMEEEILLGQHSSALVAGLM